MTFQLVPRLAPLLLLACCVVSPAAAGASLQIYGPGGPAPAMQEAAKRFETLRGVKVTVTAGPTPQWADKAKQDADVIYSGAENMMSDFAKALPGSFELGEAQPLYLRPVAILVRPGNPKRIQGFKDLLAPGVKVLTVAGAGQTGLWEDVAGRTGDIEQLKALRRNIVWPEAANSAAAKAQWTQQKDIDAWIIWSIWQVANKDLADVVEMDEPHRIYRPASVVVTKVGKGKTEANEFVAFLISEEGSKIFGKWGWRTR